MVDVTPELVKAISDLHDVTAKLVDITQLLLHELYLANTKTPITPEMIEKNFPVNRKE